MSLLGDFRYALRQLRHKPAFTLLVVVTLALCIGVNTAVYSVLDALLFRALPYPEPDRLGLLMTAFQNPQSGGMQSGQSGFLFETVRDHVPGLRVAAYSGIGGVNFSREDQPEYVQQRRVSAGYFHVLGIAPRMGREFTAAEDVPGGPALAVLSYEFWQRAFQGDASVLGRAVNLRGEPFTVVGVMPRGLRPNGPVDVWTPLRPSRTGEGGGFNYEVVARLQPGVAWATAEVQVRALVPLISQAPWWREYKVEERLVPLQTGWTGGIRSQLMIAWAAVLAVLLIGCVNVAGLLLGRSAGRSREIATRMALGGGRAAIVRQLMVESLLLAVVGCATGIGVGSYALDWIRAGGGPEFDWRPVAIDGRVLVAMLGMAVVTSVVFGLAPAISTSRLDIRSVLMEGGRGSSGGRRNHWRGVLVASEVALSLVLLVSAGLLVRSLAYLRGLNPGFDTRQVMAAQASLQDARYGSSQAVDRLFTATLERIRAIPGVESAGAALTLPYERPLNNSVRILDGRDPGRRTIEMVYVTPQYFETMRIPLLVGRALRDSDIAGSGQVAVVSESFARQHFHGDALGHHVQVFGGPAEIVGIVGDVQQHSGIGDFGPVSIEPTLYVPVSQTSGEFLGLVHGWFSPKWVIRAGGSPAAMAPRIQEAVAGVDPWLPIASFRTVDEIRDEMFRPQSYQAGLFSALGTLALLLAAVGLYGLISQTVTQRTHEIGVRMALGATARQAMASVLRPGMAAAAAGVAAGTALALAATRFLSHLLWGVRAADGATFAVTACILAAVAAIAAVVPASRILGLDPARTLRDE